MSRSSECQETNVFTWGWFIEASALCFFFSFLSSWSLKQSHCFSTFWTFPSFPLSLTSISCFGALLLFPPWLSQPLQRYLSLPTCLFSSATFSFSCSVREGPRFSEPLSAFLRCAQLSITACSTTALVIVCLCWYKTSNALIQTTSNHAATLGTSQIQFNPTNQ